MNGDYYLNTANGDVYLRASGTYSITGNIMGPTGATGAAGAAGASFNVAAPVIGIAITMGTAFQPRSGGACAVVISASLSGILGLNELVTIAISATSGGTFTTIGTERLLIALAAITDDRNIATLLVPTGYWLKVTRSGTASTATYSRTDL